MLFFILNRQRNVAGIADMTDFKNVYFIENTEIHVTASPPPPRTAIKVGMYCHLLLNSVITQAQAYLFFPSGKGSRSPQ